MAILKGRSIRRLPARIPSGYVIGRESQGEGQPELIRGGGGGGKGKPGPTGADGANGISAPADISFSISGTMSNSEVVVTYAVATAFTLPINLTNSVARSQVASTNNVSIGIQKNNVSIGSIVFNVSATGTFTFAAATSFASGDIIKFVGPVTRDPTLADVAITLKGTY